MKVSNSRWNICTTLFRWSVAVGGRTSKHQVQAKANVLTCSHACVSNAKLWLVNMFCKADFPIQPVYLCGCVSSLFSVRQCHFINSIFLWGAITPEFCFMSLYIWPACNEVMQECHLKQWSTPVIQWKSRRLKWPWWVEEQLLLLLMEYVWLVIMIKLLYSQSIYIIWANNFVDVINFWTHK